MSSSTTILENDVDSANSFPIDPFVTTAEIIGVCYVVIPLNLSGGSRDNVVSIVSDNVSLDILMLSWDIPSSYLSSF